MDGEISSRIPLLYVHFIPGSRVVEKIRRTGYKGNIFYDMRSNRHHILFIPEEFYNM